MKDMLVGMITPRTYGLLKVIVQLEAFSGADLPPELYYLYRENARRSPTLEPRHRTDRAHWGRGHIG